MTESQTWLVGWMESKYTLIKMRKMKIYVYLLNFTQFILILCFDFSTVCVTFLCHMILLYYCDIT